MPPQLNERRQVNQIDFREKLNSALQEKFSTNKHQVPIFIWHREDESLEEQIRSKAMIQTREENK